MGITPSSQYKNFKQGYVPGLLPEFSHHFEQEKASEKLYTIPDLLSSMLD